MSWLFSSVTQKIQKTKENDENIKKFKVYVTDRFLDIQKQTIPRKEEKQDVSSLEQRGDGIDAYSYFLKLLNLVDDLLMHHNTFGDDYGIQLKQYKIELFHNYVCRSERNGNWIPRYFPLPDKSGFNLTSSSFSSFSD